MKKKYLMFLMLLAMGTACFAQETESEAENSGSGIEQVFDIDFKFYIPSWMGIVTGDNPYFGLRENVDEVDKCTNFMIESRSSVFMTDRLTFSWSFASGGYIENNSDKSTNLTSFELSLGLGVYLHLFDGPTFALNGLCLYFYPAYQIPVYTGGYTPYLKWKAAFDLGYNITVLNCITVYPYMRTVVGWSSPGDPHYGIDFGLAVGLYMPDNRKK